jgi:glycosyltransferase involved in cell wall biosynthesis
MSETAQRERDPAVRIRSSEFEKSTPMSAKPQVAIFTGGQDRHYVFGLAMALISRGMGLEVIGGDSEDGPEMHVNPQLRFLNLHGSKPEASIGVKIKRALLLYVRLMRYALTAQPKIFHILWNNQFQLFDRTFLMLYYKALGKTVVLTAHNVNAGRRDGKDSPLNRVTLRVQYRLADHIFVHTKKMKDELGQRFHVSPTSTTIIPYGINNAVADTDLTRAEAKRRMGIRQGEKTILFFGALKSYKGLEYLVAAFQKLAAVRTDYRLIIAGERKKGSEQYWARIQQLIADGPAGERIIQKIEFIPDDETEVYFKAADVAVLPYTEIFQSGILFLAYSFGLPVVATDVGSFVEDIVEGRTGFICRPCDSDDLAATMQKYFESSLFRELERRGPEIRDYAHSRHSWDAVGELTQGIYRTLCGEKH